MVWKKCDMIEKSEKHKTIIKILHTCKASMAVPNDKEPRNTKLENAPTFSTRCQPQVFLCDFTLFFDDSLTKCQNTKCQTMTLSMKYLSKYEMSNYEMSQPKNCQNRKYVIFLFIFTVVCIYSQCPKQFPTFQWKQHYNSYLFST